MALRAATPLPAVQPRPRRVAVGVFDGVHRGHREVMRGADCVLTFDPHPLAVVAPAAAPRLLTSVEQRVRLIAALGIEEVVVIPFDAAFASRTAQAFVDDVLVGALGATQVSVGENFRFGHRGDGDAAMLRADGRFATRAVPMVTVAERVVSSSAVRALVAAGDVAAAQTLLGRPHAVEACGTADGAGELQAAAGCQLPAPGRYACRAWARDAAPCSVTVEVCGDADLWVAPAGPVGRRAGERWTVEFGRRLGVAPARATAA